MQYYRLHNNFLIHLQRKLSLLNAPAISRKLEIQIAQNYDGLYRKQTLNILCNLPRYIL